MGVGSKREPHETPGTPRHGKAERKHLPRTCAPQTHRTTVPVRFFLLMAF